MPPSLRDALLSAPLSFARQQQQPQQQHRALVVAPKTGVVSTGRLSHTTTTTTTTSTALTRYGPSTSAANPPPAPSLPMGYTRDLPPAVAAIIQAGRKRKAEEEGARARASTEGAERVSGYFRALSGAKSARVTAQAMGPVAPTSRALPRATFR